MTVTSFVGTEGFREIVAVILVVVVAVALHAFLQRHVRARFLQRHNDVAGYIFSAVGVIYAVLLGFVVVVVWEKYDATVSNVDREIAAVSDLYRVSQGMTDPARGHVRSDLTKYADAMIHVEWPQMAQEKIVQADVDDIEDLAFTVSTYKPGNFSQSNAQVAALDQVRRLFDARRERIVQSAPSVPAVLWLALISGALAMLFFCFMFGVENHPAQLVMTAVLAALIAILFVVIDEFDSPFSGSVRISTQGWDVVRQHLPQIR